MLLENNIVAYKAIQTLDEQAIDQVVHSFEIRACWIRIRDHLGKRLL